MKKKFLIGIVLLVIIIIIGYSAFYLEQGYKPYQQVLAEEFIRGYLKQEFRPSEVILDEPSATGDPYYSFGWTKNGNDFLVKVEYNDDETPSHITLNTFGVTHNRSVDYFFNLPHVELDCSDTKGRNSCKSSWFDENRIDLLVDFTVDGYTNYIYLCEMYKESEVYDKVCGIL